MTHGPLRLISSVALAVALLGVMAGASGAAAGDTTRVSVSSSGAQGNAFSAYPEISANGRFVAFGSETSNLVANDTNLCCWDIFVRDRQMGTTELVSVSSSGEQGDSHSSNATISSSGRYVAFDSGASLGTSGTGGVFVRDRWTKTTQLASVSSSGNLAYGDSPSISADGRLVAFDSQARNLVTGDTNGTYDIFVHAF